MATPRARIYRRLLLELILTAAAAVVVGVVLDLVSRAQDTGNYPWLSDPVVFGIEAALVVLVLYLFGRAVTTAIRDRMLVAGYPQNTARVRLIVWGLIVVAALLILLGLPGGDALTSVLFGAAVLGIILGLALQPVLSNAFSGMVIVLAAPFRIGDRVSLILSGFSPIQPSYARELSYPTYSGVVLDVGLIYTEVKLDSGEVTRFPNSVVLNAPAVQVPANTQRSYRVRLTFPSTVAVPQVEALLPEAKRVASVGSPEAGTVSFLVADISPTSWDGVFLVWTPDPDEPAVRDRLLRVVQARVAGVSGAPSAGKL